MRERVLLSLGRIFSSKNKLGLILLVAGIGVLGWQGTAHAQIDDIANVVGSLLSSLAGVIIELVGKLFIVLIDIMLAVVQYSDFINAPAVVSSWVLIRDFANMAFLIIFIAIAFATILGVEKYEYKQLLPKLLFMAVAINFSRTICGLVLDAAQVVMMTFVNGFKEVAAGNLIRGFGLTDLQTLNDFNSTTRGVDNTSLAVASILAVIILVISAVVVGVIVFMFLIRVIYLWILIILSPLAFLLAATPGMSGKFNEWWSQFVKYAMVGPILAFFLWLSFSIMAAVKPTENLAVSSGFAFLNPEQNVSAAITNISSSQNLLSFAIAIALLVMSLTVAQSLGVKGGQLAGAALSKIQSGGVKLAKLGALGLATGGAGLAAYGAYRGGKGTYKGVKKLAGTGLGKMLLEDQDRKYGKKITSSAARAAGWVADKAGLKDTSKRLKAFQGEVDENGKRTLKGTVRIGKFKETWMKNRKSEREEGTLIGEAQNKDAHMKHMYGLETDYAGQAMANLVEKRAKEHGEISMDENSIVARLLKAQQSFEESKKIAEESDKPSDKQAMQKAAIDMMALEKLALKINAPNTLLSARFKDGEVTPELISEMGNLQENPENLAQYLSEFHGIDTKDASANLQKARERGDQKEVDGILASLKNTFKSIEGAVSDEAMSKKVGNLLYAKKYQVYDQGKKQDWAGKSIEVEDGKTYLVDAQGNKVDENQFLSQDVMATGRSVGLDEDTMETKDVEAYGGSADALHWQQMQKRYHAGLGKAVGIDGYDKKFERDLGVEAIKTNNSSFAFTVKEATVNVKDANGNLVLGADGKPATKQELQTINLANNADLELHDNLYGSKLSNGPVGEAAKNHPMTTHIQSFTKGGDLYYNMKAPTHTDQTIQAVASGDSRSLSSERIDGTLGYIGLRRQDVKYPLSEKKREQYAKKYYKLHNPENGITSQMPEGIFAIRGGKLLKILGVKGVTTEPQIIAYFNKLMNKPETNSQGEKEQPAPVSTPPEAT